MALVQIPTTPAGDTRWTQRTALDGTDYLLTIYWSQREGAWLLDFCDANASPIVSGRKLVTNWPLLFGVLDARAPTGILAMVDTQGEGADAGFADLGGRCVMVYGQPADFGGGS